MNLTKNSIYSLITSVLFLSLIAIPFMSIGITDADSSEQRTHKELPQLQFSKESIKQFPHEFELYFNDNFGFRSTLLDLYHNLTYYLFHLSGSDRVIVGKKDWLFYAADKSLEDMQGLSSFTEDELKAWESTILARTAWLKSQGIEYRFIVPPDKHSIYPEHVNVNKHQAGPSRFQQLINYFPGHFINLLACLMEKKGAAHGDNLYFHTDTHWNGYGAYFGYLEIMKSLGGDYLKQVILVDEFVPVDKQKKDLAVMARLRVEEYDMKPSIDLLQSFTRSGYFTPAGIDKNIYIFNSYNQNKTKKILIFHDSFAVSLVPYLSASFNQVTYFWGLVSNEQFINMVMQIKPDVVLEERIERSMQYVPHDNFQEALNSMKASKINQTSISIDHFDSWVGKEILHHDNSGYYIGSNGDELIRFADANPTGGALDAVQREGEYYILDGWAGFFLVGTSAKYVGVIVDNKLVYVGEVNLPREDVSQYFKNPVLRNSGYHLKVPVEIFSQNKGEIKMIALLDKNVAFLSLNPKHIEILNA